MDWTKIGTAALLIGMLVFIFPRMRHAIKNSPKASQQEWMGAIIPIIAVILFVILLIMSV